jgi:competence protein ComEC
MVFFYPYFRRWIVASRYAVFREMQEVFWIGIAAQLGTVPLSLYYFNQFPFFFWLAGWIVVFGGAVFLWGGSILIALDALWPFLAIWLGKLLWGMLWAMNKIIFWIHIPTWGVAKGVWVPAFVVVLLYCCVFFLGKMFITKQARWLNAFLGLMLLLGLYRNYTMYNKSNQCRLVVYHVPQKTLLDFFDGREVYTLADSMGSRPLEAASMGNRWFFGMMGAPIMLDKDIRASYPNLIMERPFLQFFDQRMVLLDDARWLSQQPLPYTTDLLLVSRSPAVRMAQVHAVFPSKLVIFDASNSRKKVDAWRKECAEMGIACHDVRTQGAWMGNWER